MNNLTNISQMTSMEIAEVTGKLHHHITRDIKDEIEKLENAGVATETKFGLSERQDSTGRTIPYYILTKEGVLQLAARYDAVVRAKLIDLAMKQEQTNIDISRLSPELQMFNKIFQTVAAQQLQVKQLADTISTIKETVITTPDNWREDINRMFNKIVQAVGNDKYRELRSESYKLLEERAHVDLGRRLSNQQDRMKFEGASKSAIAKINKMDILEADPKLKEIYAAIVKEYTIKYVA
jgi:hypothetical protein